MTFCGVRMGKLPLAVDNLKRSEHIARGQHLDEEIIRASSELGHIYLSMVSGAFSEPVTRSRTDWTDRWRMVAEGERWGYFG